MADWRAVDSPKKMNGRILFVCREGLKKQTEQIRPFDFWEDLWRVNMLLKLTDL